MGLTQVQIPYRDNLDYGIGVDLATTSPMGKVVEGEVSGVTGAGGAVTTYEIARIHTTHDLETKLGISAEASYGAGMFGSVSARFDYAKSSKVQESSLFLSITANVTLAVHSIDAPALGARAAALVGTPAVFAERYGNMFVRGIGRGGLFVAVIQINTADSESSEAISASLSGSYGLFSASAKTKFEQIQRDHLERDPDHGLPRGRADRPDDGRHDRPGAALRHAAGLAEILPGQSGRQCPALLRDPGADRDRRRPVAAERRRHPARAGRAGGLRQSSGARCWTA